MTDAASLMRALGLTITSKGPKRQYPCGEPGPRAGYRYWAHVYEGRYRFGVQPHPKRELDTRLADAFEAAGFKLMPKRTEAFMTLNSRLDDAVDEARVVMARIASVIADAGLT